ncbi:hypothetical protein DFH09DRAFT_1208997 [Mycena vulgaris]|nr:hypothetical protein DFH09DRAFT_1208997 [Mycena vulgaris]
MPECKLDEAMNSQQPDATKILADSILALSSLITEQNSLLRRRDQRNDAADRSRQPILDVPATRSSAWNALLRSTMADSIQPKADGWRSGLDALLVFLGLFSAIVTAFIIPSLVTLQQDKIAKTNEILSNITNIIVSISGVPAASLNLTDATVFVPAPSDVRFNVYLTLSLVISLSIGALAIACRGFLNLVFSSHHSKAVERLTDIKRRWKAAEKTLGPTIESLPQLLIIPVVLFILGLLDSLFSTALQLPTPPISIIAAASISALVVATVGVFMGLTLIDGSLHPTTSPFQSRPAQGLNALLVRRMQPVLARIRIKTVALLGYKNAGSQTLLLNRAPTFALSLSSDAMNIYHEILQATRDDDILDDASAALFQVISQRVNTLPNDVPRAISRLPTHLRPEECTTLLHLLSPEASIRSHRTAALAIVNMANKNHARPLRYSQLDVGRLLPSLSHAARRAIAGTSLIDLWNSEFLRAMVIVVNFGVDEIGYPPAVHFLNAEHASLKYLTPPELTAILALVFQIIDAKIRQDRVDNYNADEDAQTALLGPEWTLVPEHASVNTTNVLASLLHLPLNLHGLMRPILSWLLSASSPADVVAQAQKHIQTLHHRRWRYLMGPHQDYMVPFLVSSLTARCLRLQQFDDHLMLVHLCSTCLLRTPNIRAKPPFGFLLIARPTLAVLLQAMAYTDVRHPGSTSLFGDILEIRRTVAEDMMWKEGRVEMLLEFDRLLQPAASEGHFGVGGFTPDSATAPEGSQLQ